MRGLNKVVIIGNLGSDPELRTAKGGGVPWSTLSVATGRARKQDGQWVEETDWHAVRVFGRTAEQVAQYLRKGALVGVEGTLVYDRWTADDGTPRKTARVLADKVSFLDKPGAPAPELDAEAPA